MRLGGGGGVIVEVVNHCAALVRRQVNVEFEEEGDDAAWYGGVGRQTKQDVAVCLEEVEEYVGCESRAVGFGCGREEEDVVVGFCA